MNANRVELIEFILNAVSKLGDVPVSKLSKEQYEKSSTADLVQMAYSLNYLLTKE